MTLGIPTHQDAEMRMHAAVSGEKQRWPCLSSSIAVTVSPLRNLTGDASQQALVEAFTEELVSNLRRHGRGFLLQQITNEPRERLEPIGEVEQGSGYLVTGSTQRGSPGMLRVNVRITDAATSEYLWARRYEFKGEETELVQARII